MRRKRIEPIYFAEHAENSKKFDMYAFLFPAYVFSPSK